MTVTVIESRAADRGERAGNALEAAARFIRDPRNRDLIGQLNPLFRHCADRDEVDRIAARLGTEAGCEDDLAEYQTVLHFGAGVTYVAVATLRGSLDDGTWRSMRAGLRAVAA